MKTFDKEKRGDYKLKELFIGSGGYKTRLKLKVWKLKRSNTSGRGVNFKRTFTFFVHDQVRSIIFYEIT